MSLGVHGSPQPVTGCHTCVNRDNLTTKKRLNSSHTYDFPLNPPSLTYSPQSPELLPSSIQLPATTTSPFPIHPSTPQQPKRQKYIPPQQFSPGELGKLAMHMASVLAIQGWEQFFRDSSFRQSSINPNIRSIPHPAAPYLHRLASSGVPAPSAAPPWSLRQKDAAVIRGPHPSARFQYANFLHEDMFDYVKMGYWIVLPYSSIRHHPLLKLAPSGVVPQRERRPRPIMD